jgi:XapX domain-containing protein
MREYLLSITLGLIVGGVYSLLGTRPPAPPIVMLLGLLGMLTGERLVIFVRNL